MAVVQRKEASPSAARKVVVVDKAEAVQRQAQMEEKVKFLNSLDGFLWNYVKGLAGCAKCKHRTGGVQYDSYVTEDLSDAARVPLVSVSVRKCHEPAKGAPADGGWRYGRTVTISDREVSHSTVWYPLSVLHTNGNDPTDRDEENVAVENAQEMPRLGRTQRMQRRMARREAADLAAARAELHAQARGEEPTTPSSAASLPPWRPCTRYTTSHAKRMAPPDTIASWEADLLIAFPASDSEPAYTCVIEVFMAMQ